MNAGPATSASANTDGYWLYGRAIDLAVGCCGIYTLSIPFLLMLTATTGATSWPRALVLIMGLTINAPHYGATLVRLYERREDRRKYILFTLHVTVAITALFVAATRDVWLASVVITAYVTWSPWHFSAQNYGLLLMFLRRQGVAFDDTTKRLFYASFAFSTAMAIEGIQAASADLVFAPGTIKSIDTPRVLLWGFLGENARLIFWTTGLGYVGCLGAALLRMRHAARFAVGPAATILVTQALFTAIPVVAGRFFVSGEITLAFAPVWISMAHSAQYLWVSAYFAKRSGSQKSAARFLGKSFLAGAGVTVLPGLIFAPALLGDRAFDAGLAGLVFAVVNLHHFVMDGAIWKLRDGRVSNVLLRRQAPAPDRSPIGATRGAWIAALVWTLCSLCVLVPVVALYETAVGIPSARDPSRIDAAFARLRLVGRETVGLHNYVAREYARLGQPAYAKRHFRRSLALHPTVEAWVGLGNAARSQGNVFEARRAFDEALEIEPNDLNALFGAVLTRAIDPPRPRPEEIRQARALMDQLIARHRDRAEVDELESRLLEVEARL